MGIQLGGLSSGLDTLGIIDQLMVLERRPISLVEQRRQAIQVKYDAWKDIRSRLTNLSYRVADLKLAATFQSRSVQSGNTAVLTGTADTSASPATYSVVVTQLAQAHKVASDRQADATSPLNSLIAGFNGGTVQINGRSIVINANDSLTTVMNTINGTADVGVTAAIIDNRLVLTGNQTGATQISFVDDAVNTPLQKLGILTAAGAVKNELVAAQDAVFTVDGLQITRSGNTVSDAIPGVTLNLAGVSAKDGAGNWVPTSLTVAVDVDKAVNAIKAFVDQYNSAYEFMGAKLAKGGSLQGDAALTQLQFRLREAVSGVVGGLPDDMKQLWQIGIDLEKGVTAAKGGKLVVDETKLRAALTANPDGVYRLFNDVADGIAVRLDNRLKQYVGYGGTIDGVQQTLQNQMNMYQSRIKEMEDRLVKVRENLVSRFTAMEKSLATLKAQGQWLSQQLSRMQPS